MPLNGSTARKLRPLHSRCTTSISSLLDILFLPQPFAEIKRNQFCLNLHNCGRKVRKERKVKTAIKTAKSRKVAH